MRDPPISYGLTALSAPTWSILAIASGSSARDTMKRSGFIFLDERVT